jgi:hypothetical protein
MTSGPSGWWPWRPLRKLQPLSRSKSERTASMQIM